MYYTNSLIENAAELALQLLPKMEEMVSDRMGRHELISIFIFKWAYEAENEWNALREENEDATYYDFIDKFCERKLNAFKETYKRLI